MKLSYRQAFLIGAVGLGLAAQPVLAQVASAPAAPAAAAPNLAAPAQDFGHDKFTVRLGAFLLSNINTKLRLSNSSGQGGDLVDFTNTLGGDDSLNVLRLDGEWQFAAKHKVQLSFFDIDQSASRVLNTSIMWGDQVYPVSATVNSQFRTTVYKLNYAYVFYSTPVHEISGLIGLHITGFKSSIGTSALGSLESVSVTAPLPIFGLEWKARLTDQLTSHVSYQYFGISLEDKYSGNLSDFQAMLDYHLSQHWSVGAGYNRFVLRASVTGARQRELTMRHDYHGLMLFVSAGF